MKNMKFILLFFFLNRLIISICHGQNVEKKTVTGIAEVRVESNLTKDDCKDQASELAMINAIEQAYGTWVEQQTDLVIKDGRDYYNIIGTTKVRGEWIETISEEFDESSKEFKTQQGKEVVTFITCHIKGKVRKATPKALIRYEALNCPDKRCRTTEFYNGESLYLSFQSPVKGYLSVFLEDDDKVYRLFPYSSQRVGENSVAPVDPDREYILFSKEKKINAFSGQTEEYEVYTIRSFEYNNLYIVFSEEPYVKPILSGEPNTIEPNRFIIPKSLSHNDFQKWLAYNRSLNSSFLDVRLRIKIENK